MDIEKAIHTSTLTVEPQHLAVQVGSGDLEVLATPMMMTLMENAAMLAVANQLPEGSTTVGGQIECTHLRPTPLGGTVSATAKLIEENGRKLTFAIQATDEKGIIGEGKHIRFIVNRERFMAKL